MARYRIVIDLETSSRSMKWIRRAIRTAISAYTLDYSIHDSVEISYVANDTKDR